MTDVDLPNLSTIWDYALSLHSLPCPLIPSPQASCSVLPESPSSSSIQLSPAQLARPFFMKP